MKPIDADALEKEGWYINRIIQTDNNTMEYQTKKPTEFPAIEPERKKGKWIRHPEWQADGECGYECDQCGMGSDVDYNFCMRCGADMRGEQVG